MPSSLPKQNSQKNNRRLNRSKAEEMECSPCSRVFTAVSVMKTRGDVASRHVSVSACRLHCRCIRGFRCQPYSPALSMALCGPCCPSTRPSSGEAHPLLSMQLSDQINRFPPYTAVSQPSKLGVLPTRSHKCACFKIPLCCRLYPSYRSLHVVIGKPIVACHEVQRQDDPCPS